MPNDKVYNATFTLDGISTTSNEHTFSTNDLIFEAGITEAVKRLLRKRDDYDLIKMVRVILDAEVERDDE